MAIKTVQGIRSPHEDIMWGAQNEDCSEQVNLDYLSTNEAILTVMGEGKQVQVTIGGNVMRALRDSLNFRYRG